VIDQIGIALTGVTAVFLTQSKSERWRRYACLFGMAGQPFWIWHAAHPLRLGVMFVTVLYTFAWAKGVWQHWLRPAFLDAYMKRFHRKHWDAIVRAQRQQE
jgi:hypothetical protein